MFGDLHELPPLSERHVGEDAIEQGAATLKRLRDKIDADRMGPPSALAVITAFGYAYTRPDGVHVIPIGCLRG